MIYQGDHIRRYAQLTRGGQPFAIDPSWSVEARLEIDGVAATPIHACDPNDTDADWSTSYVIYEFTTDETADLAIGRPCNIEIQLTVGGKPSTFSGPLGIVKGSVIPTPAG